MPGRACKLDQNYTPLPDGLKPNRLTFINLFDIKALRIWSG